MWRAGSPRVSPTCANPSEQHTSPKLIFGTDTPWHRGKPVTDSVVSPARLLTEMCQEPSHDSSAARLYQSDEIK